MASGGGGDAPFTEGQGRAVFPLQQLSREDQAWLSRKYHKRVKTATNALVGVTVLSCLLFDWDTYLGTDRHIFHGVRPAIRRALDSLYGIDDSSSKRPPADREASSRT